MERHLLLEPPMHNIDVSTRTAHCDCGQLRFTVRGEPVHVHACTCTQCQRSSGSVMSYSAWFPEASVKIEGKYTIHHHCGPEDPDRFRGFCPECGTGRFFRSGESFPNTVAITAGTFAEPGFPLPDFILYWASRPQWLGSPEKVRLYQEDDE